MAEVHVDRYRELRYVQVGTAGLWVRTGMYRVLPGW